MTRSLGGPAGSIPLSLSAQKYSGTQKCRDFDQNKRGGRGYDISGFGWKKPSTCIYDIASFPGYAKCLLELGPDLHLGGGNNILTDITLHIFK
jgi:hypothetical protein